MLRLIADSDVKNAIQSEHLVQHLHILRILILNIVERKNTNLQLQSFSVVN